MSTTWTSPAGAEADPTRDRSTERRVAYVCVGGVHHLNGTRALRPDDVVAFARIEPIEAVHPANTIHLTWDATPAQVTITTRDGRKRVVVAATLGDLFEGMGASPLITEGIGSPGDSDTDGGPCALVPIFYLTGWERTTDAGSELTLHVHSQVRFESADALFIRTTQQPLVVTADRLVDVLPAACERHAEQSTFLNNHQCYYRKCFPGRELEHKYTMEPAPDVWAENAEVYRLLLSGALPGFIMEYRDEFQQWDYENHLFEIPGPPEEKGYISFIPTTDGACLVKRKWYAEDALDRREEHYKGVSVAGTYADHVRTCFGVVSVARPSFRRVRYDVNLESVRTGHVYGIFFDHCTMLDGGPETLSQCELEYLRTRAVIEPDESDVLAELSEIDAWLAAHLHRRGIAFRRGFYSKASFLRDVVERRGGTEQ